MYHLMKKLKTFDSTILLTSELLEESKGLSADEISEFVCDGVITMHYLGVGAVDLRSMRIRKMRYSSHTKDYLLYDMGANGIEIKDVQ